MKKELVIDLMLQGTFIDGEELARRLGVSRATVNRTIYSLREEGYPIISVPGKGYRLLEDDLSLVPSVLGNTRWLEKHNYYYLRECESTQDVAKELVKLGAKEPLIVVAERMSRGRGRRGRKWIAPEGGLWFTIAYTPQSLIGLQILSLAAGLSVAKSVESLYGVKCGLKWPNDVLIGDAKLAGILIEAVVEADRTNHVFVGIGVNVNNSVDGIGVRAVSLKQILGRRLYRSPLLFKITSFMDFYYSLVTKGEIDIIIKEWSRNSLTIGRKVFVDTGDERIQGRAVRIAGDGCLLVMTDDGVSRRICSGDVQHLRHT